MSIPRVTIIILNWNGWKDTIECIESLYQINYHNYDVIVVDNDSKDESLEMIEEFCKGNIEVKSQFFKFDPNNKPIKIIQYTRSESQSAEMGEKDVNQFNSNQKLIVIKNEKNCGFADGNNIAFKYALKALIPDYVLLLNNDTVVDKEFLSELVVAAEKDEKIGIVGPKTYYYDYNGQNNIIWSAGGKICWWRELVYLHIGLNKQDVGQYDFLTNVDWISGAALMVKVATIDEYPLLNSKYFFGNEDVELCIQTRNKDLKIVYVPTAKLWHKVGVSRLKTGAKIRDFADYFSFIKKNFSTFVYAYHIAQFLCIILPKSAISYALKYRDIETFRSFMSNMRYFLKK